MEIHVWPTGVIEWRAKRTRCALGYGGVNHRKVEGDGVTPSGIYPLRRVMYRPDRIDRPKTRLPLREICPDDGWCDDPGNASYNKLVLLPFGPRHEVLWRDDHIYDVIVELGFNDDPIVAGRGSAIFMHVARPGLTPTRGCVALVLDDLLSLLEGCELGSRIYIHDIMPEP